MEEFLSLLEASVLELPCRLGTVEHDCRTKHIGLYEHLRIPDASVYMALCRKVDNSVNIILREDLCNCLFVCNVCLYECIVVSIFNILKILKVSGIGQCIHIDDSDLIVILFKHIVDVI